MVVEAGIVLSGLTSETFLQADQDAFRNAVADVSGVLASQVEITEVRDIVRRHRRRVVLQDGAGTGAPSQLEVKFRVTGLASEEAASKVSEDIVQAAEKESGEGSLASSLIENGLSSVQIINVIPVDVIVLSPVNVIVDSDGGNSMNLLVYVIGRCSIPPP